VAPVRFGTVLGDGGKVGQILADQESWFTAVLARLRGKVELSVRARVPQGRDHLVAPSGDHDHVPSVDEVPAHDRDRRPRPLPLGEHPQPCGSGQQYLRTLWKASLDRPNAGMPGPLTDIHAVLSAHADDASLQDGADGTMVAAYLVSVSQVSFFERAVTDVGDRHPEIEMSLTGPWAPFSFVGEGRAYAS
ncbi:MAG: GvpL/GvpF family gas vesicle protein, partial [Actinomycetota bacterium]|nr:GvpL/GvpF family gas vesicle protein [Actinomycetota bacterium]